MNKKGFVELHEENQWERYRQEHPEKSFPKRTRHLNDIKTTPPPPGQVPMVVSARKEEVQEIVAEVPVTKKEEILENLPAAKEEEIEAVLEDVPAVKKKEIEKVVEDVPPAKKDEVEEVVEDIQAEK